MSEEKNKPLEELVWNQTEALGLCHDIEQVCPKFGCHVALTGGLLYKGGQRKDCDILFYRIRQQQEIDVSGLWEALVRIGFEGNKPNWTWCSKVKYKGKPVDLFFPDYDGEYGDELNMKPYDPYGLAGQSITRPANMANGVIGALIQGQQAAMNREALRYAEQNIRLAAGTPYDPNNPPF